MFLQHLLRLQLHHKLLLKEHLFLHFVLVVDLQEVYFLIPQFLEDK
tara:strand:+ start:318 stop:455 length:138 start_codon:yes stop_codon:yes gene_type:complete